MFKNLKKVLFALVLAFVAAFAFACGETPECPECGPEVNKENCSDFCETCDPEANKENCEQYCPEPEKCDPEANEENCKDFQDYVVPTDFYMDVPDVTVGETVEVFLDEFTPENAYKGLVFVSSNPEYATVDAKGVVTGIRPGLVTVTATSMLDDSVSASYEFEVKDAEKDLDVLKRELAYIQAELPNFVTATYELPKAWNSNVEVKYTIDGAEATKIEVPAGLAEDYKATLNIEVTYNGESDQVAGVVVWVVKDANINTFTRVEKAVAAADALMTEYTIGTKVTEDLILPATIFGCAMNWDSTNPAVIATDGKYVRPADDKAVTLSINATYGANMVKNSYAVVAKGYSNEEKLAYVKENTFANIDGKEVNTNLILPEYDTLFNAKLTYKSQSPDIVDDKGTILVYPTGDKQINVKFTVTVEYAISKNDNFTGEFEIAVVVVPENEASVQINEWLANEGKKYAAGIVHTPYGLDAENVLDLPEWIDWDVEAVKLAVKNQAEDEDLYQVFTLTDGGKVKLNAQYLRYTVVNLQGTVAIDPFTKANVNLFLNIGVSATPMVVYTGTWRSSDQGDGSLTEIQGAYDLTSNVSYFDKKVGYVKTTYGSGYWSGYVLQTEVDGQLWESYLMEMMTVYIEKNEDGEVVYNVANANGGNGGNWGLFFVNNSGEPVNIEVGTYGTTSYTLADGSVINSVGSRNNLAIDGYAPGFVVDGEGNVIHKSTDDKLEYGMENNKAYMGGKEYKAGSVITADLYAGMAKEYAEAKYYLYAKNVYEQANDGEFYYPGGDAKKEPVKVESWTVVEEAWRCDLVKEAGDQLTDAEVADYKAGEIAKELVEELNVWNGIYTANENIKYVAAENGTYKKVTAEDGAVSYVAIAEGEEVAEKFAPTYKAKDVLTAEQYAALTKEEKALVTVTYKNDLKVNYVVENLLGDSSKGTLVQYLTIPAGGYAMSWKYQFYGVGAATTLRPFTMPAEGQKVNVLKYDVHYLQSKDGEYASNNLKNFFDYYLGVAEEDFVPTLENVSKIAKALETYAINARNYYNKLADGSATKADVFPIEVEIKDGKNVFVEEAYLEDAEQIAAQIISMEIEMFLATEETAKPADFITDLAAFYARAKKYTEQLAGKRAEISDKDKEEGKVGAIVEAGLIENLKDLEDKFAEYESIKFTINYDYAGGYANSFIYYNQKDLLIPLFLKDLYEHMKAVGAFQTKVVDNKLVEDKELKTPTFEEFCDKDYWAAYAQYAQTVLSYHLFTPMFSAEDSIAAAGSVKNENYRDLVEGAKTFFNTEKGQYWLTLADWVDEGTRYGNGAGQDFWGRKDQPYANYELLAKQPNYNSGVNGAIDRHKDVTVTNSGSLLGAYRFAQYIRDALGQAIYNQYVPDMVWASVFNRHDTQASFGTQKYAATDSTVKLYDAPYREGYDFVGWFFADGENKGKEAIFDGTLFSDVNVVAKWQLQEGATAKDPVPYATIKFVNGEEVLGVQYLEKGEKVEKPADPEKRGYEFVGWATTEDATVAEGVIAAANDVDVTYYPVFVMPSDVFTAITVDPAADGTVEATYKTITEALQHAFVDGCVITLKAGTYAENLTIKSTVTILGPNADKAGNAADRAEEAVIEGKIIVDCLRSDNVTIKGIKLSGGTNNDTQSPVTLKNVGDFTFENNYVNALYGATSTVGDFPYWTNRRGMIGQITGCYAADVVVSGNLFDYSAKSSLYINKVLTLNYTTGVAYENNTVIGFNDHAQVRVNNGAVGELIYKGNTDTGKAPITGGLTLVTE